MSQTPKITGTHPAADAWPMLDEADLRRLGADIAANGQRHPIIVTPEGLILDGRNRHAACKIAGVEPLVEVQDPADPAAFVLSENNERRHLTLPQRAAATALTLGVGSRSGGRWKRGSVPQVDDRQVWAAKMSQAGAVLDHLGEDPLRRVTTDDLALDAAYQQAQAVKAEKGKRASLPDDLGALVDNGQLTIPDAIRRAALPDAYRARIADGGLTLDEAEALRERDDYEFRQRDAETVKQHTEFAGAVHRIANLAGDHWMDEYDPDDDRYEQRTVDAYTTDRLLQARAGLDMIIDWSKGNGR